MATPQNRSVIKAFKMLQSFKGPDDWVSSVELSRRAGLPEASGYRLIQTLQSIGAVVRGPHGRYRPGMLLVSLSHNVAVCDLLRETAHPELSELATRLRLTVHMGVLEDGMVTYVAKVCPPDSFAVHTRVGAQLEAYSTGLGKVLLASLPDQALDDFVMGGRFVPLTPQTITDRTALRHEIQQVRIRGYALDDRESSPTLSCMAVPIRDFEGRTVAAISAADASDRMARRDPSEVREALVAVAAAISHKMFPVDRARL